MYARIIWRAIFIYSLKCKNVSCKLVIYRWNKLQDQLCYTTSNMCQLSVIEKFQQWPISIVWHFLTLYFSCVVEKEMIIKFNRQCHKKLFRVSCLKRLFRDKSRMVASEYTLLQHFYNIHLLQLHSIAAYTKY